MHKVVSVVNCLLKWKYRDKTKSSFTIKRAVVYSSAATASVSLTSWEEVKLLNVLRSVWKLRHGNCVNPCDVMSNKT